MQKLLETLQSYGIEVPDDKKAEVKSALSKHYKNIGEYNKLAESLNSMTEARDNLQESLDSVQEQLDGFKSEDVDGLKGKITELTNALNEEKAGRLADARKIEREKTVNAFLESKDDKGNKLYNFLNDITADHYRNELMTALEDDSAKGKSISDIFTGMITGEDGKRKDGIFVNPAEVNKPRFTTPTGNKTPGQKVSPTELMRMKNENPDLDISQYI